MTKNIVGIQANSIDSLNFDSDTTLLIASELQARGFELFFFMPDDITVVNDSIMTSGKIIDLHYQTQTYSIMREIEHLDLAELKIILVRQDPPFDISYLTNTYMLEKLEGKVLFINSPQGIRNLPEKLSIINFPKFIPETLVSRDASQLIEFYNKHKKIVLKAPYGFGGNEVMILDESKDNQAIIASFIKQYTFVIAQEFLPRVYEGDKRIFIVDGEVVGAIQRTPADGNFLANLVQGGIANITNITDREKEIAQNVAQFMQKKGVFMAGIDLIGERLIEINVTSPTGFKALNRLYNIKSEVTIVDKIIKALQARA